jgi:hypothetical protein
MKNPAESPHTPPDLIRVGTRESHPLPHAPHTELTAAATDLLMISHGLASGQIQLGVRVRRSGRLLVNCANSHPNQKMKSRTGFPNHIFLPYYFARPNFQTSGNPLAAGMPSAKNFKKSRKLPMILSFSKIKRSKTLAIFFQCGKKLKVSRRKFALHL